MVVNVSCWANQKCVIALHSFYNISKFLLITYIAYSLTFSPSFSNSLFRQQFTPQSSSTLGFTEIMVERTSFTDSLQSK